MSALHNYALISFSPARRREPYKLNSQSTRIAALWVERLTLHSAPPCRYRCFSMLVRLEYGPYDCLRGSGLIVVDAEGMYRNTVEGSDCDQQSELFSL
jgi:hypothetical protein